MKTNIIKMMLVVLITIIIVNIYTERRMEKTITENTVENTLTFSSGISYNRYATEIVYDNMSLLELSAKINKVFDNTTLDGYGEYIASTSLELDVDPVVATSIMLVETGCKWKCSALVRKSNNVGGMRGAKGYLKFSSLEAGITSFLNNLAKNYYRYGLNTPELINKKYAANPNWYKDVNYYVKLIKAS